MYHIIIQRLAGSLGRPKGRSFGEGSMANNLRDLSKPLDLAGGDDLKAVLDEAAGASDRTTVIVYASLIEESPSMVPLRLSNPRRVRH